MKAVIFDMDGILFDTEVLCRDSWVSVARQYGITDMEEFFPTCIGRSMKDNAASFRERYGQQTDYLAFRKQADICFWKYIQENGLPIKPGVYEILEALKAADYQIGLASSTGYNSVVEHLKRAEIIEYFSVLATGDMVEHSKPHPDIYLLACERLGAEPGETYAIEDSPNGIRSAHAAGLKPVMVPDMIEPDREMREKAAVICGDLEEAMHWILSTGK